MNIMNRVKISLFRNVGKTILLVLLISLLGTAALGGLLAQTALVNTITILRRNIPPVVSVRLNENYIDEFGISQFLTLEQVQEVAALPYIRVYDFSLPAQPYNENWLPYRPSWQSIYGNVERGFHFVRFRGLSRPQISHIDEGLLELKEGRVFTMDEIQENFNDIAPALISYELANLNHLSVGDRFEMDVAKFELPVIIDETLSIKELHELYSGNWVAKSYSFEIIGIFEIPLNPQMSSEDVRVREEVLNSLFTPNWRTSEMWLAEGSAWIDYLSVFYEHYESLGLSFNNIETSLQLLDFSEPFWILDDILYFEAFEESASEILSENWQFQNLFATFEHIYNSVSVIRVLVYRGLWGIISATIIILNLLILLYLRERRHEIGIYLALGEKKSNIVLQLLGEVLVVGLLGFIISIGAASYLAPQITHVIFENELTREEPDWQYFTHGQVNVLRESGFGREVGIEEALAVFDVSLSITTLMVYLTGALLSIGVSMIVPIVYVLEINLKDLLSQAKVG